MEPNQLVERIRREVVRRCKGSGKPQVVLRHGNNVRFVSSDCQRGQRLLDEAYESVVGVYYARRPGDLCPERLACDLELATAC